MPDWRVRGDAGTEQGGDVRKRKLRGDLERVIFIHDNLRRVATVRRSLLVLLGSVVREDEMNFAVLLQACLAARAHSAGIHETADSGKLADFEPFHLGSDACHAPDNFVAGDHGDRKSTRLNSSHSQISYAVFCLKKKKKNINTETSIITKAP